MPLQPHPLPSSSSRWPRSGTRPATDARDRARPCLVEVAGPVVGDDGGDLHVGTSVAQHQQVCCKRHRARVENPVRAEVRCSSSTHTRGLVPPSSLAEFLRGGLRVEALAVRRRWVLRLLLGQPAGATSACAAWLDRGQRARTGPRRLAGTRRGCIQAAGQATPGGRLQATRGDGRR